MFHLRIHRDFDRWRDLARRLLTADVPPQDILWSDDDRPSLIQTTADDQLPPPVVTPPMVPRAFVELATLVGCHRDEDRWNLLYRSLWRMTHGEDSLLERVTDDDVYRMEQMAAAVRRDRHKMTAFVRFRQVPAEDGQFVAWHRPDHYIVRLTAPFFRGRFAAMRWAILTPDDSVAWDGQTLEFAPGVPESQAPSGDELESLWRTYYSNIFNPARVKIGAMKKELPVRHWPTLPETQLIPDLLADAPRRVQEMIRKAKDNARPGSGPRRRTKSPSPSSPETPAPIAMSAEPFIPDSRSLSILADASRTCRGCPLCQVGTQTVFGEGPDDARVMFVGEQPGDQEDQVGRPFVGPAGKLFDEALAEAGLDRAECYVTNTVKHFKWEPRGQRRIHVKPSSREVSACVPWLTREIEILRPPILVCLGSTAAQALLGRDFRVTQQRGKPMESRWSRWTIATVHPSSLLRIPEEERRRQSYAEFVSDLKQVSAKVAALGG